MSEIISLHVGRCGIKTGLNFWSQFNINIMEQKDGLSKMNSHQKIYYQKFFSQNAKGESIPRAIFIDNDTRSNKIIQNYKLKFDHKNILTRNSSSNNLFVEGHYLSGAQLCEPVEELIRRQVEKCDLISGFILTQSSAGGTGSGVGTIVQTKLRQNYCATIVQDFKILPGCIQNNFRNMNPLQVYNIILSTHYSIQNTDLIYCLQNKSVFDILKNRGSPHSTFQQINHYYGHILNEHISAYLYPGRLNTNQRKRSVNLIPFPRIKTICGSLGEQKYQKSFIQQSIGPKNKLMRFQTMEDKRIFGLNLSVTDPFTSQNQINAVLQNWLSNTSNSFVEWIPNPISLCLQEKSIKNSNSSWVLVNGSRNIEWIKQMAQHFTSLFRRKAYIYHYTSGGMDEMQFTEAQSNCNDLVSEYVPYNGSYEMEDEEYYNQQN